MLSPEVLEALDFYAVVEALTRYCLAEESKKLFLQQRPLFDYTGVKELHYKVRDCALSVSRKKLPDTQFIPSLSQFAEQLPKRTLVFEELALLRKALQTMKQLSQWSTETEYLHLSRKNFPQRVYDTLAYYFDNRGEIRAEHVPELGRIEKARLALQRQRSRIATDFIRQHSEICASSVPTMRDQKLLIPIASSFRSQVQGTLHSGSSSRETVYMELSSLQASNNEIVHLELERQRVLAALCRTLCETLRKELRSIMSFYAAFLDFDLAQAQYHYGLALGAQFPKLSPTDQCKQGQHFTEKKVERVNVKEESHEDKNQSNEPRYFLLLRNARHPLLENSDPITIKLQSGKKQLIFTGPNGGGKTFALKVLGLLALMNQCGIPIPVSENSIMPVFSHLAVVIGDRQDLARGFSTFYSHLRSIQKGMQSFAKINSKNPGLFLLDEICSDTDDREGGALAWAILENLAVQKICAALSTHLALLKQYGLSKAEAEIASVEPALRNRKRGIRYGIIGNSEAEQCARDAGIAPSVIQRQQALLREHGREYQEYLRTLNQQIQHWEEKQCAIEKTEQELQKQREALNQKVHSVKEREEELLAQGHRESRELLSKLRQSIEQSQELLSSLKKQKNPNQEMLAESMQELRNETKSMANSIEKTEQQLTLKKQKKHSDSIHVGDEIILKKNKARGVVLKKLGESSYQINIGILTIAAHASEIQVATKTVKTTESRQMQGIIVDRKSFSDTYKRTLDLRGCKVTEAISQLDKNIDLALLQRVKSFSVLHGKGEGVLSKVVHEHLEQHSAVQHKHFAHPEEGGHGLTRVYLEKDA